jgi:DsbC/DsbD-like thiol-disulfide interchange protein
MRAVFRALSFGLALLLLAATARAEGTPIPHGALELIADKQWLPLGSTIDVGLHFQLEKGWHIYWVNPGDSGEPPRVDWQLPSGVTVGATESGGIEWPTPQRFQTSSSIVDYGYVDAVLLIVPLHVDASLAAQATAHIGADVRLLICSHEMCIPGKAQLSLTLPIKSQAAASDARNSDLFAVARKSLPRPAPANWKLSAAEAKDSFVLSVDIAHPVAHQIAPQVRQPAGDQMAGRQITQAIFFPLAESQIENSAEQKLLPLANGFRLTLRKSDQLLKPIARLKGVLLISGDEAYWIDVPLGVPPAVRKRPR